MKQIRKRITYANVMSSIAVFLVLGGASAYAAKKIGSNEIKGNSITTGKIKKNAITSSKINKNAITTAKIKNGAVTGPKVNVTNLAKVPSATSADNATNWSRYFSSGLKKASVGQNVVLLTVGPFTFTGKCTESAGETVANTYLTTSQAGSSMYSEYGDSYSHGDFNPGTEAEVGYELDNTEPESGFFGSYYTIVTAQSADGATLIEGQANAAINLFGAPCAFEVHVLNNS